MAATWLVVGLGNPGDAYARTRHNFGFVALDEAARRWNSESRRTSIAARVAEAVRSGDRLVLMWPETYMNLSGEAVRAAADALETDAWHILVIHDDVDLPLGRLKVKQGGGDGGHRGVASVIAELETPDFIRIRGGIGRPVPAAEADITDYVLEPFAADEVPAVREMSARACDAAEMIMDRGVVAAMNRFNRPPPASPGAPNDDTDNPQAETDTRPTHGPTSPTGPNLPEEPR